MFITRLELETFPISKSDHLRTVMRSVTMKSSNQTIHLFISILTILDPLTAIVVVNFVKERWP